MKLLKKNLKENQKRGYNKMGNKNKGNKKTQPVTTGGKKAKKGKKK
jgi:hypothetical protein